ncbi:MAG: hypothetical protein ACTSPR_04280, partial [Candidatus Thorarchaeota archaeon]
KPIPEEPLTHGDVSRYHVELHPEKELPYTTQSICPECFLEHDEVNVIDATLYEEDGKVMFKKTCEKHAQTCGERPRNDGTRQWAWTIPELKP